MKKFYTIALASAVALSASAGTELKLRTNADFSAKTLKTDAPVKLKKSVKELTNAMPALKKSKKAAVSAADIAGEYTITLGDFYYQGGKGEYDDECTISVESGLVIFEPTQTLPFGGTLNESDGIVTFSNLELGLVDFGNAGSYYVRQEPYIYSYEQEDIIPQTFTATYADGSFSFPAEAGISWAAYSDANYTQLYGYADIQDILACVKNTSGNDDDTANWTSLGNATFMDGWVLPLFGIDQTDSANQWEVELQQNNDNHHIYRLVDPYHSADCPVAADNNSTKKGYITFDVTDPDHVVFSPVESGFAFAQAGLTKMYCINFLTAYMNKLNTTDVQTTVQALAEADVDILYATFKNGVVDLPSSFASEEKGYDNAACFGIQGDPAGMYVWQSQTEQVADMAAKIIFPETGIDNVVAGEADAPVKYFNLQGIEVAKPAAGQVVIRKQGNNATKFMAR